MTDDKALAVKGNGAVMLEKVLIDGDLGQLQPAERVNYYRAVCESVGLNYLTKPFDYIRLNGKLVLYAKRDAAEQLRAIKGVSITRLDRERIDDVYVVTAYAQDKTGRQDSSTGVVTIGNLKGDALANAFMKAETKAKRRVTLSICGLGWLDETEIATIPDARPVNVIPETGEIVEGTATKAGTQQGDGNHKAEPPTRPFSPDVVRKGILDRAAPNTRPPAEATKRQVVISLNKVIVGGDEARHTLTQYLIGKEHSEAFTDGECKALIAWVGATKENDWSANGYAIEEAKVILALVQAEAGQQELPLEVPADVEAEFEQAAFDAAAQA